MKCLAANGQQLPANLPSAKLPSVKPVRAALTWRAKLGVVMTSTALLAAGCADMPAFHSAASTVGMATTPAEGVDFVKTSRPSDLDYTPVGIEPGHPPDKPRDPAGVKKLQSELEAQRDAGHAILQKLSPGVAADMDAKAKAK